MLHNGAAGPTENNDPFSWSAGAEEFEHTELSRLIDSYD